MKLEQNLAGPELITSCKETQLTRLQCRVEQLATQPRRHSLKIINLCESHDGDDDNIDEMTQSGDTDRHSGDERGAQSTIDMFRVVSFLRCLNFDSKFPFVKPGPMMSPKSTWGPRVDSGLPLPAKNGTTNEAFHEDG